jgi:hypothetical protein
LLAELVSRPQPLSARARYDLAAALWDLGLWNEATAHMWAALEMAGGAGASSPLISTLRFRLALASIARGVEEPPGAIASGSSPISEALGDLASLRADAQAGRAARIAPQDLFDVASRPSLSVLMAQLSAHNATGGSATVSSTLAALCPELEGGEPPAQRPEGAGRVRGRVLSVGVVSGLFYDHPVGIVTSSLLRALSAYAPSPTSTPTSTPPQRARVTLYAFPAPVDQVTRQLARQADEVVQLPMDWRRARALVRPHHDLLLLPDAMDADTYFLAHARLAPIQVIGGALCVCTTACSACLLSSARLHTQAA